MKHLFAPLFVILFALTGCSKKSAPALIAVAAPQALLGVPSTLTSGTSIAKKLPPPKKATPSLALSRDVLQLALGLRDAARGKIHAIPALSRGSLLQIENLSTTITFESTSIVDEEFTTTHLNGSCEKNIGTFTITQHTTSSLPQHLQTTLRIIPKHADASFGHDVLEEVFDTIEAGYASNEISIMLSCDGRVARLCRQGSDLTMSISLEPRSITYQIDGYGLDVIQFLTTILNIPQASPSQLKKEVSMKKNILFILMPRGFQDLEFCQPHNALAKAGYTVDVAGLSSGVCVGSAGTQVTPNKILSAMTLADFNTYEAVVIPGGNDSPTFLWGNEEVQAVVRYFHEHNKLVATICYASIVPAQAGLLKNQEATVYPTDEAKEIFAQNGVIFNNNLCISLETEHIITAQSPQAIEPFIASILKQLEMQTTQKEPLHA
jgi:putative intracellular protease/amidase